jgi:anti-sigma-K factor RskA
MDEHLQEQASAYALGILPESERAAFEQELDRNAELRVLVREFTDAIGGAAQSLPDVTPSAGLKERVMKHVADNGAPASQGRVRASQPATRVSLFPSWIPWAAAAGVAIVFALHYTNTSRRIGDLRQETASVEAARTSEREAFEAKVTALQNELIAARDAADFAKLQVARLTSEAQPRVQAVSFWNNMTKQGVLVVENLALPPPGKTYQLWVIDPETKSPVDAGIFSTAADGTDRIIFSPKGNIGTATAIAVSLEDAGGVAVPTQVVMAGATAPL